MYAIWINNPKSMVMSGYLAAEGEGGFVCYSKEVDVVATPWRQCAMKFYSEQEANAHILSLGLTNDHSVRTGRLTAYTCTWY